MKIERYYYSNAKIAFNNQMRYLREQHKYMNTLPEEEQIALQKSMSETIDQLLMELIPVQGVTYTMLDIAKLCSFKKLINKGLELAEKLSANIYIDTEDMTGCIILVAEEMNFTEEMKTEWLSLADAADELHLKLSVDYGEGSSTDIDGILQMELWFDFFIEQELME